MCVWQKSGIASSNATAEIDGAKGPKTSKLFAAFYTVKNKQGFSNDKLVKFAL